MSSGTTACILHDMKLRHCCLVTASHEYVDAELGLADYIFNAPLMYRHTVPG